MRTSQKRLIVLLREARQVMGVRSNRELFDRLAPLGRAIKEHIGGGILSPYRDGTWGITWLDESCRDRFAAFNTSDLALPNQEFLDKVLPGHGVRVDNVLKKSAGSPSLF